MQIDHIIYADLDLDAAVARLENLCGVRAGGGGKHLGQGTHNKLLALGPRTYLEVIAPDPEQPEPSGPRPYGVDGISGGGLVGWALACEDIRLTLAQVRARGFDPGDVVDGQRVGPTGTLRWRVTGNAMTAGIIPFLIDWGDTAHPASTAPRGLVLESLHLEHPDPSSINATLNAVDVDVPVTPAPEAALVVRLTGPRGRGELR
jgi:hypothetical protein